MRLFCFDDVVSIWMVHSSVVPFSVHKCHSKHRNIMEVLGSRLGSISSIIYFFLLVDFSVPTMLCQPGWFIFRSSLFRPTNTGGLGSHLFYSVHFGQVYLLLRVKLSISTTLRQPGWFILRSFFFLPALQYHGV